jgi:asparagine synthase (glutamine-hydrolysing)
MCGIAGKLYFDPGRPADTAAVRRMIGRLVHRGPDDEGMWSNGPVALGHRRLSVIDTSAAGRQPMSNEDGSVWISYNGEVYNHADLRRNLEARGHIYRSRTDTETILHLYEEQGPACVNHLVGMFAFAVWDARARCLVLARDRLGKKPLFYYASDDCLVFASELAALLQDEAVPADIDDTAIHHYFTYGYVPGPGTIFRGVRRLPPASTLVWREGRISIERYWRLAYSPKIDIDEPEAAAEVLRLLREAVRARLVSDVPIGALLSGGIDSSAVVALMSQESGSRVSTFTIGFDEDSFDERPHARTVANRYGTAHHEFTVTPRVLDVLPELVWAYGEPFADASSLPTYYVAKLTRRYVTVALTGDGGDESFAGYERYVADAFAHRYGRLPAWLRQGIIANALGRLPEPTTRKSVLRRLKRFALADQTDPVRRYSGWLALMGNRLKADVYSEAFRSRVARIDSTSILEDAFRSAAGEDPLDRVLFTDVHTYLPDDLLVKMDIAAMAHSLEVRSPFLDHRLMEFAAGLPAGYKLRGAKGKYILKKALTAELPRAILDRGKFGFSVPVGKWFRGELADTAVSVLSDPNVSKRGYLSGSGVKRILDDHRRGAVNHGARIWQLLVLELWFRTFIDRRRADLNGPADGIIGGAGGAAVR